MLKSVISLSCQLSVSFNFKNSSLNVRIVRFSLALAKPLLLLLKSVLVPDENSSSCITFSTPNCSHPSDEAQKVMFS